MAKDLSGTNVAVEKARSTYKPAFLLQIVRDHPDFGESVLSCTTWSGKLDLGGTTYIDRILSTGDVRRTIAPGGGLAVVGNWTFALNNPQNLPKTGRLSDMVDRYPLENDEVRYSLVFRNGSEGSGDILRLYTGLIQDPVTTTKSFEINTKDGSRIKLRPVPNELTDLVRFPYAPLNAADLPYPLPFGNLNVEPFNTSGARPILAACRMVDQYDQKYTAGLLAKTYGQPYVFYRSAKIYGKIVDYTVSGTFFTIDTSSRWTKIRPIRAAATNDVADWKNVVDGNISTGATITTGENLDLQMRGCPKLGTVTAIEIRVEASGDWSYSIEKPGEAAISDSATDGTSIDISGWDFSDDWDFEQITVKIDGPGSGSTDINLVTLDVTFDEQETGDNLAFPVYQSVSGYQDLAAQYYDGGVITGAGTVLRNPLDQAVAMMRDRRTGMRLPVADIVTSNLATERAKISDWYFDFSLETELSIDDFSDFLRQAKIRLSPDYQNQFKFSVFEKTDDPAGAFFAATNIATANPTARANQRESSFIWSYSPLSEIYNEIIVNYGWDPALGTYTQQKVASPNDLLTGTGTLSSSEATLTDATKDFVAEGVQVGYKLFMVRDKAYEVTSVATTMLGVTPVDAGVGISNRTDTYYIGPNFDYRCYRSKAKYKTVNRLTISSRFIQDEDTAVAVLDHQVDYWSTRRIVATFRTWLNAVDLELGDLIIIDHPDLPASKRPVTLGTISENVSKGATTIPLSGTGAALTRIDDRLVIAPGDSRLYRECAKATDTDPDAGEITVSRAYAGTLARPWRTGDVVQRIITKWEITGLRIIRNRQRKEIEITVRETPRDYTPIGNAAPNGTAAWRYATAEEQALYGWASFQNGEVEWLNEDTAVSYARTA